MRCASLFGLACVACMAVACQTAPSSSVAPSNAATPTASRSPLLVFTKWVADPNANNGPEPGFKPAFTGLTSHDIQGASAAIDASGSSWVVNVSFTLRGKDLFAQLTRDNVAACPNPGPVCSQRHLGIWLDLTQTDIDRWDDPAYAAKVSQPLDMSCLARTSATTVCPKLVSDPVTLQEIYGGTTAIVVGTEQFAKELAKAINSTPPS